MRPSRLSGARGWHARALRAGIVVAVFSSIVGLWAIFWDSTDFLPSPGSTWDTISTLLGESETYDNLWATARRLIFGLAIGYVAGVTVAIVMASSRRAEAAFAPYIFITITSPSLAVALISLMVFGLSEIGVYLAVAIVVFPFVVVSLTEALAGLDTRLQQMTHAYGFSRWERIRHQALPEIAPFLFAAFRNVHALAWKIVVIVELFSQQNGIGFQYKEAFNFFELERLIAWSFFFMVMVLFVEYGLVRPFETFVFRWRRRPTATHEAVAT